jgi:hypothetical protein
MIWTRQDTYQVQVSSFGKTSSSIAACVSEILSTSCCARNWSMSERAGQTKSGRILRHKDTNYVLAHQRKRGVVDESKYVPSSVIGICETSSSSKSEALFRSRTLRFVSWNRVLQDRQCAYLSRTKYVASYCQWFR